jgi:hypothetical protein
MEIFLKLLLDIGLILALMLSTIIVNCTLINLFGGGFTLRSFNFGMFSKSSSYIVTPVFMLMLIVLSSFLLIASYFYSNIFYLINGFFKLSNIVFVSGCFFVFMFFFMGCNDILINVKTINNYKESGDFTGILWEEIDSSLTPAIIHTLLVILGMLITYYQFK